MKGDTHIEVYLHNCSHQNVTGSAMNASRARSASPFRPTPATLWRSARVSSHWPMEALLTATWETRALKNSSAIEFRLCCAMLEWREVKYCCKLVEELCPPFCLRHVTRYAIAQNVLHCFRERRERRTTLGTATEGGPCFV